MARLRNNQVRPTAIRNMKRGGLDDRFIQTVTDHVVLATLGNYDPEPEMTERLDGAVAIMTVQKPKIRRRVETVTSEVTRRVSKTSIHADLGLTTAVTRKVSKTSINAKSGQVECTGRSAHIQKGAEKG